MAPILVGPNDELKAPPASLLLTIPKRNPEQPHIQYYLGYSDHESEGKTAMIAFLRDAGCTPQAECSHPECQRAAARGKSEWEERRST